MPTRHTSRGRPSPATYLDEFDSSLSGRRLSGTLMAMVGCTRLGLRGHMLRIMGNSITALAWAITVCPHGKIVNITDVELTPGVRKKMCDRHSRRLPHRELPISDRIADMGFGGTRVIHLKDDVLGMELLRCCDTTTPIPGLRELLRADSGDYDGRASSFLLYQ